MMLEGTDARWLWAYGWPVFPAVSIAPATPHPEHPQNARAAEPPTDSIRSDAFGIVVKP
jgi:hypothetical protein